jgi:hypothetical protein
VKQDQKAMKVLAAVTPPPDAKPGKRIEIDGKFYRMRRGQLVEIPEKWVGKITTDQTKRKRDSKVPSGKKAKEFHDSWSNRKRGTETSKRQKPITDEDID